MLQRAVCSLALSIFTTATMAGAQPNYPGEALPSGAAPSAPGVDPAQSTATVPSSQPPTPQPAPQLTPPAPGTSDQRAGNPPSQSAPQLAPTVQNTAPNQRASNPYYGTDNTGTAYSASPNAGSYDPATARQPTRTEPTTEPHGSFEWPTMSIRIDPLNWLLSGRLGFELESQVWKFISVEFIPMFIVNDQPPFLNLNLSGVPNNLYQKSGGIGALAGAAAGVGFWFSGKPMEGYVLRAEFTDYVVDYESRDAQGPIDKKVETVERAFEVLIGSHSKWGPFTLAGTIGLGSMLNHQNRCVPGATAASATTSGCANRKELSMAVTRNSPPDVVNLHDWTYPIVLVFRLSLGVVF